MSEGSVRRTRFGRRYRFSAAHRLHSGHFSDEENRRIYGKCNNPAGHGHNYTLTVVVEGEPDPRTGMVIDMATLDEVAREILDRFDYHHLDLQVAEFAGRPSTAEHIVETLAEAFTRRLEDDGWTGRLQRLELSETRNNRCCLEFRNDTSERETNDE